MFHEQSTGISCAFAAFLSAIPLEVPHSAGKATEQFKDTHKTFEKKSVSSQLLTVVAGPGAAFPALNPSGEARASPPRDHRAPILIR